MVFEFSCGSTQGRYHRGGKQRNMDTFIPRQEDVLTPMEHVYHNVLHASEASPIWIVLYDSGVTSFVDFMVMDKEDFEECVGTITHDTDPTQDRTIRLSRVQIKKLLDIQNWYRSKGVEDLSHL